MKKVSIDNLSDSALDYAVGATIKMPFVYFDSDENCFIDDWGSPYQPSSDWFQGGKIIESEQISLDFYMGEWVAKKGTKYESYGASPLIAAMRCFVKSNFGDVVEIPQELI